MERKGEVAVSRGGVKTQSASSQAVSREGVKTQSASSRDVSREGAKAQSASVLRCGMVSQKRDHLERLLGPLMRCAPNSSLKEKKKKAPARRRLEIQTH